MIHPLFDGFVGRRHWISVYDSTRKEVIKMPKTHEEALEKLVAEAALGRTVLQAVKDSGLLRVRRRRRRAATAAPQRRRRRAATNGDAREPSAPRERERRSSHREEPRHPEE